MQTVFTRIAAMGQLLGAAFYYAPDDERAAVALAFFRRPDWQTAWAESENRHNAAALIRQGITQDLSAQFQRLFIGPNVLPAPPWGSVYLDPESVIFGTSLLKLRAFLQRQEVTFDAAQTEPEDHIGVMLMLAAYFAEHRPHALAELLQDHLLNWADHFLDLLTNSSDAPFYQGLAWLTRAELADWQAALRLNVPPPVFYR